ncbi:MAG: hypothetical protein HQK81_11420 [Desulfovibrionaceae bacterium]|nr:hypothetical protein [Desulfovibrionaceae bacterium]MBF0514652.1 hypothetical protein [Desulfovibrionaceae bacterium]
MVSKRKAVLVSCLAVLAIVYGGLIFTARYAPFPVGLAHGHLKDGDALSDIGLTRYVLGASTLWLAQGDQVQLFYEANAPLGALYLELSSIHVDGPRYKSEHYLPGKESGRLTFTIPFTGVYQLSIGATRRKTSDGPSDKTYDVEYDARWQVK